RSRARSARSGTRRPPFRRPTASWASTWPAGSSTSSTACTPPRPSAPAALPRPRSPSARRPRRAGRADASRSSRSCLPPQERNDSVIAAGRGRRHAGDAGARHARDLHGLLREPQARVLVVRGLRLSEVRAAEREPVGAAAVDSRDVLHGIAQLAPAGTVVVRIAVGPELGLAATEQDRGLVRAVDAAVGALRPPVPRVVRRHRLSLLGRGALHRHLVVHVVLEVVLHVAVDRVEEALWEVLEPVLRVLLAPSLLLALLHVRELVEDQRAVQHGPALHLVEHEVL